MKCLRPIGLMLTFAAVALAMPSETTTARSASSDDTMKKLVNPLADIRTSTSAMTLDVRTPPKVKQHILSNKEMNKEEFSHAGVAIPVDEDSVEMEEVTKKMNFFKLERPTTNSGLSTWILLSGQTASTTKKPTTKKHISEQMKQNLTVLVTEKPLRQGKPIFKKKTTIGTTTIKTTKAPTLSTKVSTQTQASSIVTKTSTEATTSKSQSTPTQATSTKVQIISSTTVPTKKSTKLTKIKASDLSNAIKKTTTITPTTINKKKYITTSTTQATIVTTDLASNSSSLLLEAKNGEVDLSTSENKKKKNTSKRKKNKTRRRKPQTGNSTSIAKPSKLKKEKPVSTMLYNYLSREIMPTVGVGLVGLMVTAGLASYFLYPFGIAAKRVDTVDRKDREGYYHYRDEYSGGMPEEEAIGKVIAGMPSNSLFSNDYKPKPTYPSPNYRLVDRRSQKQSQDSVVQGSVENVPLTNYKTVNYNNDVDEKKFVVGNIPKQVEDVTPVTVPEHGPRSFGIDSVTEDLRAMSEHSARKRISRKKRDATHSINQESFPWKGLRSRRLQLPSDVYNDSENEIGGSLKDNIEVTTIDDLEGTTDMELTTIPVTTFQPDPSLKTDAVLKDQNFRGIGHFFRVLASTIQMIFFLLLQTVSTTYLNS